MPKEIKTIKVTSSSEAETIRAYQSFGWALLNNQEVYVKDSHLRMGTFNHKIYNVTETTHYVKLTFERDPSALKNYDQLRALEAEYHAIPLPPKKPVVLSKGVLAMLTALLLFYAWVFSLTDVGFMGFAFVGFFVAMIYWLQKRGKSKLPAWNDACADYRNKQELIINRADQYLRG